MVRSHNLSRHTLLRATICLSTSAQPGIAPTTETFTSVLTAMARGAAAAPPAEAAAVAEAGLGVFRAMLAAPGACAADAGAYGALVQLQARAGQWARALAVYDLMLSQVMTGHTIMT